MLAYLNKKILHNNHVSIKALYMADSLFVLIHCLKVFSKYFLLYQHNNLFTSTRKMSFPLKHLFHLILYEKRKEILQGRKRKLIFTNIIDGWPKGRCQKLKSKIIDKQKWIWDRWMQTIVAFQQRHVNWAQIQFTIF